MAPLAKNSQPKANFRKPVSPSLSFLCHFLPNGATPWMRLFPNGATPWMRLFPGVFWNGLRAGAMGEVDGDVWGLLISVPKTIPVAGYGKDAVVAIRLRSGTGRFTFTPARRTSWIGTEASIQEPVETWRGERLRQALPQLLIAASLLLSAFLFLLLPLWRRDAPEYFWFGLWLLSGTALRV